MKAAPQVRPEQLLSAVAHGQPFVCRRWLRSPEQFGPSHPAWRSHSVQMCELSDGQLDVGRSSVWLREHGSTVTANAVDVLRRLDDAAGEGGGLYVFGGRVPPGLIGDIDWPQALHYEGSSHYIATPGVRATLHYDSWWAFLLQIRGEKRILLHPPRDYPFLYASHQLQTGRSRRAGLNVRDPDLLRFPLARRLSSDWTVILQPGDLFFLPCRWWHEVEALSASVGVNRRFKAPALACAAAAVAHAYYGLAGRCWYRTSDDFPGRIVGELLVDTWRGLKDKRLCWPRARARHRRA